MSVNHTLTIFFNDRYRSHTGVIHQNVAGEFVFSSHDGWIEEYDLNLIKDSLDGSQILALKELGWRP